MTAWQGLLLGTGYVIKEPTGVCARAQGIIASVPDGDRHADPGNVKCPGPCLGDRVVDPAVDAAGVRGSGTEQVTGSAEPRGKRGPVGLGQIVVVRDGWLPFLCGGHCIAGELLDKGPQGNLPGPGPGELLNVAWWHPLYQSRPSASKGAGLTTLAQRVTRSPSNAAHASACGAPPDAPQTANCSQPR